VRGWVGGLLGPPGPKTPPPIAGQIVPNKPPCNRACSLLTAGRVIPRRDCKRCYSSTTLSNIVRPGHSESGPSIQFRARTSPPTREFHRGGCASLISPPWTLCFGHGNRLGAVGPSTSNKQTQQNGRRWPKVCGASPHCAGGPWTLQGGGGAHSRPRGTIFKRRSQFGFPAWNPRNNLHTSVGKDHGIAD